MTVDTPEVTLKRLVSEVRDSMSAYQRILYILSKPENAQRFSCDPQLIEWIQAGDVDKVRWWFDGEFKSLTLAQLRDAAQREGVYPIFGKSRSQLLLDINNVRRTSEASAGQRSS